MDINEIKTIIDGLNNAHSMATAENIGKLYAERKKVTVDSVDIEDALESMEAVGMIGRNGNCYYVKQ